MVCCGHCVGVLSVVGVGVAGPCILCVAQNHRLQAHRHCADYRLTATAQITGSPPLLSDLDILCEMEHEGLCHSMRPMVECVEGIACSKNVACFSPSL